MTLSKIEDVIKDASQGKIFILVDDENMNDKEESNNDVDSDESDTDYDVGEVAKEVAETVFYMIDRDGDGDISRGEMMKAINQIPSMKALIRRNKYLAPLLNPKTWKDTFRAIDVSSDGKISLDEFKNFAVNISLDTNLNELPLVSSTNVSSSMVGLRFSGISKRC